MSSGEFENWKKKEKFKIHFQIFKQKIQKRLTTDC